MTNAAMPAPANTPNAKTATAVITDHGCKGPMPRVDLRRSTRITLQAHDGHVTG
jgi:hypothetical protein